MTEHTPAALLASIAHNVETAIYGKRDVIDLALCALLADGHMLIEDVPGVGKTSLASALARSFSCTFRRIQFTPDLMPSDVTGFSMFHPQTGDFIYREGAIMAQIVLADEINRASPKTQSCLLEVMEERQVTVDGHTYELPRPFLVLATQNPLEYVGTYPLPEAQLDRFFMRIAIGYPSAQTESEMLSLFDAGHPLREMASVATAEDLLDMQRRVRGIYVDPKVKDYITAIVRHTRANAHIALGASPRASLHLYRAAQAWALYHGREYATPEDVRHLAEPVIAHRLVLNPNARLARTTPEAIVREALGAIPASK